MGSPSHIYAFVNLGKDQSGDVTGDYFLVPSAAVRKLAAHGGEKWPVWSIYKKKIEKYRNNWAIFESRR